MLTVRLAATPPASAVLALPVYGPENRPGVAGPGSVSAIAEEVAAMLADAESPGRTGTVNLLPRPGRRPSQVLAVGIGDGDEAGWRGAGAAVARAACQQPSVTAALPADASPDAVRGFAEGLWLASYHYSYAPTRLRHPPDSAPANVRHPPGPSRLRQAILAVAEPARHEAALAAARATADATRFARDLTNTPSMRKNPAWFAAQVSRAAGRQRHLTLTVRDRRALAAEGFGAILAVGGGSASEPRLVELSWRPPGAGTHVVLVGKGITFDSGGISIKSRDTMALMRKDMGGAAAIVAATLGAAAMKLPVRVTALAPLAENMVGADAYRPGDVIRHYGGQTTEVHNTDAEGRLVLADALAYAAHRLRPDVLVDLATLTGASRTALGARTAALFSDDDDLAAALSRAAARAGEQVWRLPLPGDYVEYLSSEVADYNQWPQFGAGAVVAALYLREFTGQARQKWAHLDMSSPAWSDRADGELVKGATGWGVRTLLRWLTELSGL